MRNNNPGHRPNTSTLEEKFNNKLKIDLHNTITIHPIKNSWAREEVETLLFQYASDEWGVDSSHQDIKQFNKWVKNNL